jgi:hypothetical protein
LESLAYHEKLAVLDLESNDIADMKEIETLDSLP